MILGRPGVGPKVGLSVHGSSSANFSPDRVTSLAQAFQKLDNLLIVCLIICYKDCFHGLTVFCFPAGLAAGTVLREAAVKDRNDDKGDEGGD